MGLRQKHEETEKRNAARWGRIQSWTSNNHLLHVRPYLELVVCRNGVVAGGKSRDPARHGDIFWRC